jgi:hypothetical protein
MHEFVAADRDADVRGARRDGSEEHEVARLQLSSVDLPSGAVLIRHRPGHRDAMLAEDVPNEPAAVEPGWIASTVSVGRPAQRQRRARHAVSNRSCATLGTLGSRGVGRWGVRWGAGRCGIGRCRRRRPRGRERVGSRACRRAGARQDSHRDEKRDADRTRKTVSRLVGIIGLRRFHGQPDDLNCCKQSCYGVECLTPQDPIRQNDSGLWSRRSSSTPRTSP